MTSACDEVMIVPTTIIPAETPSDTPLEEIDPSRKVIFCLFMPCIRRSFGATTTETTGTASAVHRNRLDGFLEPLNKSRPSLRAD